MDLFQALTDISRANFIEVETFVESYKGYEIWKRPSHEVSLDSPTYHVFGKSIEAESVDMVKSKISNLLECAH